MKKLLILLLPLLFLSNVFAKDISDCKKIVTDNERLACYDSLSTDVISSDAIVIQSISKLLNKRPYAVTEGSLIYGCLVRLEFEAEDLITKKRKLESITIGTSKVNAVLNIDDFENMHMGDTKLPKIGDCFAFYLTQDLAIQFIGETYYGSAVIYKDAYNVDDNFSEFELDLYLTISEFFEVAQWVNYGSRIVELTGEVRSISSESNTYTVNLIGDSPGEQIQVEFRLSSFEMSEQTKNSILKRIPSINIGDTLTVLCGASFMTWYQNPPLFTGVDIVDK